MNYDVAVIGLGGMGSAILAQTAARGAATIGVEQYHAAHDLGSSHGRARMMRKAYFEDPAYYTSFSGAGQKRCSTAELHWRMISHGSLSGESNGGPGRILPPLAGPRHVAVGTFEGTRPADLCRPGRHPARGGGSQQVFESPPALL